MKDNKQKGFTLVELLVVITIIGVISLFVFPSIHKLQIKNSKKKYIEYKDALEESGHVYTDSYSEDMFGITSDGCYIIKYDELVKKNLIQKYEDSDITCNNDDTFVKVERKNGKYTFKSSLKCTSKKSNKVIFSSEPITKCDGMITENQKLGINVNVENASPSFDEKWSRTKRITITVSSDLGLNANTSISYGWSPIENGIASNLVTHNFKNNGGEKILKYTFVEDSNKNGIYYFYVNGSNVIDINGKFSNDYKTSVKTRFDNSNPNKPTISNPTNNSWVGLKFVNENKYVLNVKSSDDHSGVAYYQYRYPNSKDSSEQQWTTYKNNDNSVMKGNSIITTPFLKERNENVEIRACDYSNNCSTPTANLIKIDRTVPKCKTTSSANGWTNNNVTITGTCTDKESGCKNHSISSNISSAFNSTKSPGTIYDLAGNSTKCPAISVKIDRGAPVVKWVSNSSNGNWTNQDVKLTLNAKDNDSGIAKVVYSYDKQNEYSDWDTALSAVGNISGTWGAERNNLIYARAYDKTGNVGAWSDGTAVRIDKKVPKCDSSSSVNGWTNGNVTIVGRCSDNASGCKKSDVRKTFTSAINSNNSPGTIYDNAGNKTSCPQVSVKIDRTGPSAKWVGNSSNGNWTNQNVDLTLNVKDNESGVGKVVYSYDKRSEYSDWNSAVSSSGNIVGTWSGQRNSTVYARAYDKTGNPGPWSSGTTVRIDKNPPSCSTSSSVTGWTNGNVTIVGTCTDNESGCKGNEVRKTFTTNHNSSESPGVVYDNAGNSRTCGGANVSIDKTDPTVSYSKNGGTYNTKQSVTITASDSNFSRMEIQVHYNGSVIVNKIVYDKTFTTELNNTGSYTIYTKVYDHAGNKNNQDPENQYGWYYQNYQLNLYNCNGIGGTLTRNSNGDYICVKGARYYSYEESYDDYCVRNVPTSCNNGWYCETGWDGAQCYETIYVPCTSTRTVSGYTCDSWSHYDGSDSSMRCYTSART